jgi:hypothetical protein
MISPHRSRLVPRRYPLLAALVVSAVVACHGDLLEPASGTIAGRWRREPMLVSPTGQFDKSLEFTEDGHYTVTYEFRGVYPQLPADAVAASGHEYGTYVLSSDTLRFTQDSSRTWDYLGGTSFHVGPAGISIEGPPTDPIVALTAARLTLRYSVNPGGGYEQVTEVFDRDR